MTSFVEFLSTFDGDINRRGKQFERFVKWFLKNDPEWATQVEDVWLWDEYPGRWGPDCGIDLVFKSKIGKTWAVQAKCYSSDYDISKNDVDTFLSESNRKQIDHRLLIATTDGLGANARQVLDAQEKSVVRYLLSHFESAAVEFPDGIQSLSSGKRKPPPELDRPHQIEAVDAVLSGFQTASRGQLIMACGTGKTFVCLWVKERLKAKRTLVLVPSLNLLSQLLNEWTFAAREPFDALCVCSDQTVSKRDDDEAISQTADIPFPVSSDVDEIAEFLKGDKDQVIFSTYQSSPLIEEAQKQPDVPRLDLVIADEAHRCAGKSDTVFGTVLDDRLIKSDRRLFATATPRVYRTSLKKAADEEFGVEVVDMNDEKRFGKRFHTLTFGEAIKREQLTDYRVLIVGVDDERVKEWIENRRLVATDTGLATDARSLAAQIGLLKAIKDWNLRRLISFHGRVKGARIFSEDIVQAAQWLDDAHRPSGNLWADHVSGEMPTIARKQKLKRLKNVGNGEIGLLSNARCLSEGVDVPALDGVAFIDPRSSEIDIIQSVGRAIRLSDNKTMGTIVIPVFIEQADNAEAALEASDFKPIWDVLEALKSHDDRLSDELDQLRIELGAKRKRSVGADDLTKIVFDLPTSVSENFAQSLRAHLVEQTTESWMFWYGLLEAFVNENKHCSVSGDYRTSDGYGLGKWINQQRILKKQDNLSSERITRLDAVGFIWDALEVQWQEGLEHLNAYVTDNKNSRIPQLYRSADGFTLGRWVAQQRNYRKKNALSAERIARLDALGFIWDPFEGLWEKGFEDLKDYVSENKNCNVAINHKSSDGYGLGSWINHQRLQRKRNNLSAERIARLDALGFIWDARDAQWEEGLDQLEAYVRENNNCDIPAKYKSSDGHPLGYWLSNQRQFRKNNKISAERLARLDAIGVIWDVPDLLWDEGFSQLKQFSKREGHCRVLVSYKTDDGYQLGRWIAKQRSNKDAMLPDRRQRLEALAGWAWDVLSDAWEEGFSHLKQFSEQGHCRVPQGYKTDDDYRLGQWVANQRTAKDTMDPDRRQRLEALPGWSWNALLDKWEEGFSHLKQFSEREGHCRVPRGYKTDDDYRLAQWVANQRTTKDKMESDRRQRLEALPGWSWNARLDKWEEGFSHLKQFSEQGHCRVPQGYKTDDDYRLAQWVGVQRTAKDTMESDRRQRLAALPGWSWNARLDKWEEGFSHLKQFSEQGHCRVPQGYKTNDGYGLGDWVSRQREAKDKMESDRRQRLAALPGWVWKVENNS